ncbi:hypothetical protein [Kocuria rosea]|uniref:Uncharacterized protein n=1 Tax=Kocuria rosea TaxID=1275 RepID=A0A4R5YE62_KOCRO|nr:hypothetical protein [Kocuria rosea]TDL42468.1 hypothetical protein E2R59_11015 [Kocuria rosea]
MDETAQRTDAVPVPKAGQVFFRALAAAAVLAISLPLATWWLREASSDGGPWWGWLLILVATIGLSTIIQRYMSPPRPRIDPRTGQAQWAPATATAVKTGELPACPEVRTAVGVAACVNIEGLFVLTALLVAIVLSAMILPELWSALTPVAVLTGMAAFRVRRSWVYLRALHAAERTG